MTGRTQSAGLATEWGQLIAPELLTFFRRRVSEPEDAADLLAECLLTMWRRRSALPPQPEQARMWSYGIATNTLRNWRRARRRFSRLTERLREELLVTGSVADLEGVRDAISRLPPDQGDLVRLVHWEGFTIVEAAAVLRISETTARGRYQRARRALAADPAMIDLRPAWTDPVAELPLTEPS